MSRRAFGSTSCRTGGVRTGGCGPGAMVLVTVVEPRCEPGTCGDNTGTWGDSTGGLCCGDNVGGPGETRGLELVDVGSGDCVTAEILVEGLLCLMLEDGTLYWIVVPDGIVMVCGGGSEVTEDTPGATEATIGC